MRSTYEPEDKFNLGGLLGNFYSKYLEGMKEVRGAPRTSKLVVLGFRLLYRLRRSIVTPRTPIPIVIRAMVGINKNEGPPVAGKLPPPGAAGCMLVTL